MRAITQAEYHLISGGLFEGNGDDSGGSGGSDGGMQVVPVTASYADAAAAREEYASQQNAASFLGAAAGFGAALVVTGICEGIPALAAGPETLALTAKPCTYVGGIVGTGVGTYVSGYLKSKIP